MAKRKKQGRKPGVIEDNLPSNPKPHKDAPKDQQLVGEQSPEDDALLLLLQQSSERRAQRFLSEWMRRYSRA